jgi:hypothetical protein
MQCSGRSIVAYSGKLCQRRARTDEQLPHGDFCQKMVQVFDVGGHCLSREEDKDKFVREMGRAEINDSTLKEIML